MVADQHELLRPEHDRDQTLGSVACVASSMSTWRKRIDAIRASPAAEHVGADDVGRLEQLALGGAFEREELLLVGLRELAQLVFEHLELV